METQGEADWLGGLPGAMLYIGLGASGLMLARVAAVAALVLVLVARREAARDPGPLPVVWRWGVAAAALLAISPELDPLPMLFDLLGVAILWKWLYGARCRHRARARSPFRSAAVLGLLFLLWSNLSIGVALGAGLLAMTAIAEILRDGVRGSLSGWRDLGVALLGGSLNPRGIWTWMDSLRWLLPATTTSPAVLDQTPWALLPRALWGFSEYVLIGLTLLWIGRVWWESRRGAGVALRGSLPRLASFLLVQCLAWLSASNVPLAIIWLACELNGRWRPPPELGAPQTRTAADAGSVWNQTSTRRERVGMGAIGIGMLVVLTLSGRLTSIGWGIDSGLDHRMLDAALSGTTPYGTAFADDVRSGGMLVWVLPPTRDFSGSREALHLQDVPRRALIGGRLAEHQQIARDLREGRLTRYWRDDGSAGGWWLTLRPRDTSLLCISHARLELVEALEPTLWKPLSLDSPVIPYAQAGDPAYAERLIEVLRYRRLVNLAPWSYALPSSTGSPFDRDLMGLDDSVGSPEVVLQQARTFRAMGLPYAALRVSFVGRQHWPGDGELKEAVRRTQAALADAEQLAAGQASWLRDWAAQSTAPQRIEPRTPPRRGRWLDEAETDSEAADADGGAVQSRERLLELLAVYLSAGPGAALEAAEIVGHPQILYARLCWAIESGQHDVAHAAGRRLETHESLPANLRLLLQYRLNELASLSEEPSV